MLRCRHYNWHCKHSFHHSRPALALCRPISIIFTSNGLVPPSQWSQNYCDYIDMICECMTWATFAGGCSAFYNPPCKCTIIYITYNHIYIYILMAIYTVCTVVVSFTSCSILKSRHKLKPRNQYTRPRSVQSLTNPPVCKISYLEASSWLT